MTGAWSPPAAGADTLLAVLALLLAILLVPGPRARAWLGPGRRAVAQPGATRRWCSVAACRRGGLRGAEVEAEALLTLLDVVAPSLRAGRTPEESIRLACGVAGAGGLTGALREALDRGRSPVSVLEEIGRDHPDARLFAQAWRLSSLTGCPLADTADCVARMVRAKLAHRRRVLTSSAGARASIRILMALPLGGPLLALGVGVDPVAAYLGSPPAWGGLGFGVVLVLAGRAWVDRLISAVARGPVLGPA